MVSTALSRRLKLAAPVLAVGVVAAGVTVPRLADAADASAALPPRTAAQLLEDVSQADVEGLSGTVVATSRLGLPELPSDGGGGSAVSLTGLLSGSTTARVWKAGDDRSRVAVDAPFAEYDVVRDGTDVWTFDSASSDVTHLVLPEGTEQPPTDPAVTATPQDLAERLLASVEPTTTVTVGRAEEVAGRAAYELVLEPKDAGHARRRGAPRGRRRDQGAAAGAGVRRRPGRAGRRGGLHLRPLRRAGRLRLRLHPAVGLDGHRALARGPRPPGKRDAAPDTTAQPSALPQVLGSGWSTVVETSGVQLPESAEGMLGQLSTPVEGGRTITSALVSVLLTDDGRMLVGSVPPARLVELAGR